MLAECFEVEENIMYGQRRNQVTTYEVKVKADTILIRAFAFFVVFVCGESVISLLLDVTYKSSESQRFILGSSVYWAEGNHVFNGISLNKESKPSKDGNLYLKSLLIKHTLKRS